MKNTIYLRAHTEMIKEHREEKPTNKKKWNDTIPKWPEFALVFDCETTTDEKQSLTFGSYRLLRNVNGSYGEVLEEGFFCPNDAPARHFQTLKGYAKRHVAETSKDRPQEI